MLAQSRKAAKGSVVVVEAVYEATDSVLDKARAEVDQQAQSLVGQPDVGDYLLSMYRMGVLHRLELNDHQVLDE